MDFLKTPFSHWFKPWSNLKQELFVFVITFIIFLIVFYNNNPHKNDIDKFAVIKLLSKKEYSNANFSSNSSSTISSTEATIKTKIATIFSSIITTVFNIISSLFSNIQSNSVNNTSNIQWNFGITASIWDTTSNTSTPDPWRDRCKEVRRRVSHGLEDYARRSRDEELQALVQPIFTNKKLVVWSADHHIGPISDLRSLFEPLGVEFLEHTLFHNCQLMCTCDQLSRTKVLDKKNVLLPLGADLIERFVREYKNDTDFNRASAYVSSWSAGLIELFMRYNKSIVFYVPLRIDTPLNAQREHFKALAYAIRKAATNEVNVMAANNRYDVHYIKYITGMTIDYVPSFCLYTGETYNPIRKSFLLWERRYGFNHGLRDYWTEHFDGHIKRTGYKFDLRDVRVVYKEHEYRDVAKHLAITYIPYQVSVMSFFEQYRMDIPLLCPTKEFLIFLHHRFYTVYDRTVNGKQHPSARGSPFRPHPSMAGTPDPNNDFDLASISYWLPLSDCYQFPYIIYFESFENLVETLQNISETRLWQISGSMRMWNIENLKEILRYWRRRLIHIAFYNKFE